MHKSQGETVRMLRINRLSRHAALRSAAGGGFVALAAGTAPHASSRATQPA